MVTNFTPFRVNLFKRFLSISSIFMLLSVSAFAQRVVYFKKPSGWGSNVNIHYWSPNVGSGTSWPGVAMASAGDYFAYVFPSGVTTVSFLFNDGGGNQTSDINSVSLAGSGSALFYDGGTSAQTISVPGSLPVLNAGAMWIYKGTATYNSPEDGQASDPFNSSPYIEGSGARTYGAGPSAVSGPGLGCNNNDTSFGLNLQCPDASNTTIRKNDGSGWLKSDVTQGCPFIQSQIYGNCGANCGNGGTGNPEGIAYADYSSTCNGTKNTGDNFPSTSSQVREVKLKEWTNTNPVSSASSSSSGGTQVFFGKSSTVNFLDNGVGNGTGIGGDEARALIIGGNTGSSSTFNITSNFTESISIGGNFGVSNEQVLNHNQNTSSYTQSDAGSGNAYRPGGDWVPQGGVGYTGSRTTNNPKEDGSELTVTFSSTASIGVTRSSGSADIRVTIGPGMGGKANLRTTYEVWEVSAVGSAAFPVKLTFLKGNSIENKVVVSWETTEEENSSYFILERSSNAIGFEAIGKVLAKNEGKITNFYSFDDLTAQDGPNYYRLRMVDLDGTYKYSTIISVIHQPFGNLVVYPNPAADELKVIYPNSFIPVEYEIFSENGNLTQKALLNSTTQPIDLSELRMGNYFIRFSAINGNKIVKRFTKF